MLPEHFVKLFLVLHYESQELRVFPRSDPRSPLFLHVDKALTGREEIHGCFARSLGESGCPFASVDDSILLDVDLVKQVLYDVVDRRIQPSQFVKS